MPPSSKPNKVAAQPKSPCVASKLGYGLMDLPVDAMHGGLWHQSMSACKCMNASGNGSNDKYNLILVECMRTLQ